MRGEGERVKASVRLGVGVLPPKPIPPAVVDEAVVVVIDSDLTIALTWARLGLGLGLGLLGLGLGLVIDSIATNLTLVRPLIVSEVLVGHVDATVDHRHDDRWVARRVLPRAFHAQSRKVA